MAERSTKPESPANHAGDDWEESDRVCPCGKLMWTAAWWDDTPEMGGGNIGTIYECGDCGEYDTF